MVVTTLATPPRRRWDFNDPLNAGYGAGWTKLDTGGHQGAGVGALSSWISYGSGDSNTFTNPSVWLATALTAGGFSVHMVPQGGSGSGTTGKGLGVFVSGTANMNDFALTGTISTTATSGAVVGVGTAFLSQLAVGDSLIIGAEAHAITAIADDTHLTTAAWTNTNIAQAGKRAKNPTTGPGVYWKTYQLYATPGDVQLTGAATRLRNIEYILTFIARPSGGVLVYISGGIYGSWPTATLLYVWDTPTLTSWFAGITCAGGGFYVKGPARGFQPPRLPSKWRNQYGGAAAVGTMGTAGALNTRALEYTDTTVGALAWTTTTGGAAVTVAAGAAGATGRGYAGFDPGASFVAGAARFIRAIVNIKTTPWFRLNFRGSAFNDDAQDYEYHNTTHGLFINGSSTTTGSGAIPTNSTATITVIDNGTSVEVVVNGNTIFQTNNSGKNTQHFVGFEILGGLGDDGTTISRFECWMATGTMPAGLSQGIYIPAATTTAVNESFTAADNTRCDTLGSYTEIGCVGNNHFLVKGNKAKLCSTSAVARTGTVTTTALSGAVVGVGTKFLTEVDVGTTVTVSGESHTVTAITDDLHLTTGAWVGSFAGAAYTAANCPIVGAGLLSFDVGFVDNWASIDVTLPPADPGASEWRLGIFTGVTDANNWAGGIVVYQSGNSEYPEANQNVAGSSGVVWFNNVNGLAALGGTFTLKIIRVANWGYAFWAGELLGSFPLPAALTGTRIAFGVIPAGSSIAGVASYDNFTGGRAA